MNVLPDSRNSSAGTLPAATTVLRRRFRALAYPFYRVFIKATSPDEDIRRREFILNIILLGFAALSTIAAVIFIAAQNADRAVGDTFLTLPVIAAIIIPIVFWTLLLLSRQGYVRDAAIATTTLLFIAVTIGVIIWGPNTPWALLGCAIVITIGSIAVSARAGLRTAFLIIIALAIVAVLHEQLLAYSWIRWDRASFSSSDVIQNIILLCVIATLFWLSHREIESSLLRARTSESLLKEERDLLEARVEERTQALKQAQLDQVTNMYRLIEFGRLASGIFHDLMGPLTAVVMSIDKASSGTDTEAQQHAEIARNASRKMENLLVSVQKQLKTQQEEKWFSPSEEIQDALDILGHKIRGHNVEVQFKEPSRPFQMLHKPLQFYQVVFNLLSNAIDACAQKDQRLITISLEYYDDPSRTVLMVQDTGCGIAPQQIAHIFEPFYTTKDAAHGTGLGLATTKHIIDKEFGGSMTLKSSVDNGTTFAITIPIDPSRIKKVE
jgi:signal transduction histidine kinase